MNYITSLSPFLNGLTENSAERLQNSLEVLMKIKNGTEPEEGRDFVEMDQVLRRIEVSQELPYRNTLEETIEVYKYVLLMVYMIQKNEKAALDLIKNEVKLDFMDNWNRGALDYAIESKMTAVIVELLGHNPEPAESYFEMLQRVIKTEPQPISEEWEKIKDMMIENVLSGPSITMSFGVLSILISWNKSSKLIQVMDKINADEHYRIPCNEVDEFLAYDLFSCDSVIFDTFIRKFDYILHQIYTNGPIYWYPVAIPLSYLKHRNMDTIISNLSSLLKSDDLFSKEVRVAFYRCDDYGDGFCTMLLMGLEDNSDDKIPWDQFEKLADFLQNSEVPITTRDMDAIYDCYGYESVFKNLLLRPVALDLSWNHGTFARFYYDPDWTLERAMSDRYFLSGNNDLVNYVSYFAHPELKSIALESDIPSVALKVSHMPEIPRLVEYARNAARKHIVDVFQISNFQQLHSLVHRLPISDVCAKILLFEQMIY